MKGLLDTHTFLWCDNDPSKLSPAALAFLQDPASTVLLSVVSIWEIVIKQRLGKLALRLPLNTIVAQQLANGMQILPMTLGHVFAVESLPSAHKDPFDRMLAAQANIEGAELVSADPIFAQYPVKVLW